MRFVLSLLVMVQARMGIRRGRLRGVDVAIIRLATTPNVSVERRRRILMKSDSKCVHGDCDRDRSPKAGRGLCAKHYGRFRRNGELSNYPTVYKIRETPEEYFLDSIDIEGPCWEWRGSVNANGYGVLAVKGIREYAHRWSWETYVDTIPEGLTIDHLCRNTLCVHPDHLEVVSLAENSRRAHGNKTHCAKGHSMEDAYVRPGDGWRMCRECTRERNRKAWRERKMVDCEYCGRTLSDLNMRAHQRKYCRSNPFTGGSPDCPNNRPSQWVPYLEGDDE